MRITNMIKSTKEALAIKPFHSSSLSAIERQENNQRLVNFALATIVLSIVADPSFVLAGGTTTVADPATAVGSNADGGPLGKVASAVLTTLTGGLGQSVAAIGVVALGIMAIFGKLAWDTAIKAIVGIGLVFGASSIVKWISGAAGT